MFRDMADMPGMGNDLDCSKKKQEEQDFINQELQKITVVTFAFGLFYSMHANHKTVKEYVPGYS